MLLGVTSEKNEKKVCAPSITTMELPWGLHVKHLVMLAVAVLVLWWLWRRSATTRAEPDVPLLQASAAQPAPPATAFPGVPQTLLQKMSAAQDTNIPVVMTSGSPVQYDDTEIENVVKNALDKVNAQDENLTLMSVSSASKTQDSYKTVAYDVVANVYDSKTLVGLLISVSVLVAADGKTYLKTLKLYNDVPDPMSSLQSAADPAGQATYSDPLDILASFKVTAPS